MTERDHHYILIGYKAAWKTALENSFWGFTRRNRGMWNTISVGEHVMFYITSLAKRIIGTGIITEKFESDELLFRKSLWRFRVQIDVTGVVKDWAAGVEPPKNMMLNTGRKVVDKRTFYSIQKSFDSLEHYIIQPDAAEPSAPEVAAYG